MHIFHTNFCEDWWIDAHARVVNARTCDQMCARVYDSFARINALIFLVVNLYLIKHLVLSCIFHSRGHLVLVRLRGLMCGHVGGWKLIENIPLMLKLKLNLAKYN